MSDNTMVQGNAYRDHQKHWITGHFIDEGKGLLHSHEVEIKWVRVKAGESKGRWTKSVRARTMSMLVKGKFLIKVENKTYLLEEEGDFLVYGSGLAHTWEALEDSLIVAVRWPSVPNEEIEEIK